MPKVSEDSTMSHLKAKFHHTPIGFVGALVACADVTWRLISEVIPFIQNSGNSAQGVYDITDLG